MEIDFEIPGLVGFAGSSGRTFANPLGRHPKGVARFPSTIHNRRPYLRSVI